VEQPLYGLLAFTLVCAVILHLAMRNPPVEKNFDPSSAFESLMEDEGGWGGEADDKEKKSFPTAAAADSVPRDVVPDPTTVPSAQHQVAESFRDEKGQETMKVKLIGRPAPSPKPPSADGSFQIGDRVILKGLVGAKELNGRHGVISGLRDKNTQRYQVDMDLLRFEKPSVSVKEGNMEKEPSIPPEMEEKRCLASNAVLEERDSRSAAFTLTMMHKMSANTLKGEKNATKLSAFSWTFWTTPDGQGVYPSLCKCIKEDLLKLHGAEKMDMQINPVNPEGAYKYVQDAQVDLRAVKGWAARNHGEFWIMGVTSEGTYLIPCNNTRAVYLVLGLRVPLGIQLAAKSPRPPKFRLTLLPWYGRIFHDFAITTTTASGKVEMASPELTKKLMNSIKLAEEQGRVIERFAQLEVPGGSSEGIPFPQQCPPQKGPTPRTQTAAPVNQPPIQQEPASEAELKLMDNVVDFEPFTLVNESGGPSTPEEKLGVWNFIRRGRTEKENPLHECMVINANGQGLGNYKIEGVEPTTIEILKTMLGIAAKAGKRPSIIGVDDPKCAARLQFLFKETRGTRVVPINVRVQTQNPQQQPPNHSQAVAPQEPASEVEHKLMLNVVKIDAFTLRNIPAQQHTPQEKMGVWNFIRKGETEEENPSHEGVIVNANGQSIGNFTTEGVQPTAAEILKAMLGIAIRAGKRPAIMGIDDPKCAARLQFLFKGSKGTIILPINVTRKKGPPPKE